MRKSYFQLNPVDVPNPGISNPKYTIAQAWPGTPVCGKSGTLRAL